MIYKREGTKVIKKLWPTLLAIVSAVVSIISPQVQHAISTHPAIASILGSAFAIFAHFMPQPQTPTP